MDSAEFLLGTVMAVSSAEGVQIRLDGQDEAMSKYYKMLITGANWPSVGDRVVIMKHSGTYVVMGKIGTPSQNAGKVNRAGDTMTGDLNIRKNNPASTLRNTSMDAASASYPEANSSAGFLIYDKNGQAVAQYTERYETSGATGVLIGGAKVIDGSRVWNYLRLLVKPDGTFQVLVTSPAAWRTALGALYKAGDTMTGSLTLSAGNAGIYEDTTAYEVGVPPSSDFYTVGLRNRDKNGTVFTAFNSALLSNGNIAARMLATKGSISNYLQLVIDSNNNLSVLVSNAQAWRKALGLGTNGAFPITVAQGGTGNTGVVSETTIANVIDVASGFTIEHARYHVWGKLAMFYILATATAAVTTNQWTVVGTLKSGKRPKDTQRINAMGNRETAIASSGALQVWGTFQSGEEFEISATYLLA